MANSITINGRRIEVQGNNVSVINGRVLVGGVEVAGCLSGIVKVEWSGELASLESDCSVSCGTVAGSVTAGGSVHCDNVTGNVKTGGSVHCGKVGGSITAGGSVRAG